MGRRTLWIFSVFGVLVLMATAVVSWIFSAPRAGDAGPAPPGQIATPEPETAGKEKEPDLVVATPVETPEGGQKPEPTPAEAPGEKEAPESAPSDAAWKISLPGGFPKNHLSHTLVEASEKEILAGVDSYFTARYQGPAKGEFLVRLVGLQKESADGFLDNMLDALAGNATLEKIEVLVPGEASGWDRAGLYGREGAGVYYSANTSALLIVSGPTPEEARAFGEALAAPGQPKD